VPYHTLLSNAGLQTRSTIIGNQDARNFFRDRKVVGEMSSSIRCIHVNRGINSIVATLSPRYNSLSHSIAPVRVRVTKYYSLGRIVCQPALLDAQTVAIDAVE
jgi:hypothetical protein